MNIIVHNLLKNPNDLPKGVGRHNESNDVYLLYRILDNANEEWSFLISQGTGFYNHDEKLWYGYYNDYKCRIASLFSEKGGQEWDYVDSLIEKGCPQELIDTMTEVPQGFAYDDSIGEGLVFTTEIIGWYEFPNYKDFVHEK